MQVFLNQPWQQIHPSLILLFGKTKAVFGKDAPRKKLCFGICYLWETEKKPVNKNRGRCFSMKSKATCKHRAHLDEHNKNVLKSHLLIVAYAGALGLM